MPATSSKPRKRRGVVRRQHHRQAEQRGGGGLDLQEQEQPAAELRAPFLAQRGVARVLRPVHGALGDMQAQP